MLRLADRSATMFDRPRRIDAAERDIYEALCDEALDYYESGDAQRRWLRAHMLRRYGEEVDPRRATSTSTDTTVGLAVAETDAARMIREGRIETVTVPLVRSIVDSVAVLYSADDFERRYYDAGEPDLITAATMAAYHEEANVTAVDQRVDGLVSLLGACCYLIRWCPPRDAISYDVVYPHAIHVAPHPDWPLDVALAHAVAYREGPRRWCAYVRPPLAIDPPGSLSHAAGPSGRMARYEADHPWPVPPPGHSSITDDGPNPLVAIGGLRDGQLVWSPLVWCWSRPPTETLFPPPATDLVAANREIDLGLSWLQYLANVQSHGQAVKRGSGPAPRALGPHTVVEIDDPSGGFDYVSPGANIGGLVDVIQRQMQLQAILRHLSPDMYSLTRPSIQTGPAKLIEQHALIEARWRRTLAADGWERARFQLERLLHNAYGLRSGAPAIPLTVDVRVRWGELRVPTDRAAQVQRLISEISMGVTSRLDAAMEIYGLDRADAERHLEDVDAFATAHPSEAIIEDEIDSAVPDDVESAEPTALAPIGDETTANIVPPDSALNGAQVTALLEVVAQTARGEIPRATAVEIIVTAFPVDRATAERIVPPDSFRPDMPVVTQAAPAEVKIDE